MEDRKSRTSLRVRYVFPVIGSPIQNGIVSVCNHRIEAIGENSSDSPPLDLGNVAIVPGLVNAHTHLEFSKLDQPLGNQGEPLPRWIRRVIEYRRANPEIAREAIELGLTESVQAGVTAIGEISNAPFPKSSRNCQLTMFHEVIGLDAGRMDETLERLDDRVHAKQALNIDHGVSPHAPYTLHPDLFGALLKFAAINRYPVAMHLAESPEELELLRTGGGPFRELLESLDVWREDANPQGYRPLDYLQTLSEAPRALVVHGNYLDEEEIEFLAKHNDRMAVVFCPRTHAYFGHTHYPLNAMLERGVTVCLGTDSRASNPDLNLFEELKCIAAHYPEVPPQLILQCGTTNGAKMLGSHDSRSAYTVIALPDDRAKDPYDLLFATESHATSRY